MNIWTQKSASIQPRTSRLKFDDFAEKIGNAFIRSRKKPGDLHTESGQTIRQKSASIQPRTSPAKIDARLQDVQKKNGILFGSQKSRKWRWKKKRGMIQQEHFEKLVYRN